MIYHKAVADRCNPDIDNFLRVGLIFFHCITITVGFAVRHCGGCRRGVYAG